jgi:hypothetical protein
MTASAFRAVKVRLRIELLEGLKPQEVDLALKAARQRKYSAKTVMTRQGEPANEIKVLLQGRARYFYETQMGKKLILNWITPGQTFAGLAALSGAPHVYPANTETVQDSVVLGMAQPYAPSPPVPSNTGKGGGHCNRSSYRLAPRGAYRPVLRDGPGEVGPCPSDISAPYRSKDP